MPYHPRQAHEHDEPEDAAGVEERHAARRAAADLVGERLLEMIVDNVTAGPRSRAGRGDGRAADDDRAAHRRTVDTADVIERAGPVEGHRGGLVLREDRGDEAGRDGDG